MPRRPPHRHSGGANERPPPCVDSLARGTIWFGSYEHGANEAYKLGVSELDSVTPSSLGN